MSWFHNHMLFFQWFFFSFRNNFFVQPWPSVYKLDRANNLIRHWIHLVLWIRYSFSLHQWRIYLFQQSLNLNHPIASTSCLSLIFLVKSLNRNLCMKSRVQSNTIYSLGKNNWRLFSRFSIAFLHHKWNMELNCY